MNSQRSHTNRRPERNDEVNRFIRNVEATYHLEDKPEAPTNAQIAIRLAAAEDNAEGPPEGHADDDEIDEDSV